MNLNFNMNILPSFCYTCEEFRAPPTSGLGWASAGVDRVWKSPFYASLWQLGTWGLSKLLTLDLWSRRPKLPTNLMGSLELPRPWCLKNGKKTRLVRNGPFLRSYHSLRSYHIVYDYCIYINKFHCNCYIHKILWYVVHIRSAWAQSRPYAATKCKRLKCMAEYKGVSEEILEVDIEENGTVSLETLKSLFGPHKCYTNPLWKSSDNKLLEPKDRWEAALMIHLQLQLKMVRPITANKVMPFRRKLLAHSLKGAGCQTSLT